MGTQGQQPGKPLPAEVEALAGRLRVARHAYYNGATPLMTDAQYDAAEGVLATLAPGHPLLAEVGAPPDVAVYSLASAAGAADGSSDVASTVIAAAASDAADSEGAAAASGTATSDWQRVVHQVPAGTVAKARDAAELDAWYLRMADLHGAAGGWGLSLVVSEKLDGISVSLVYSRGSLQQALTRGDGSRGLDITDNVRRMVGVPAQLPGCPGFEGLVRGEILCEKHRFPLVANLRNTASGAALRRNHAPPAKGGGHYTSNSQKRDMGRCGDGNKETRCDGETKGDDALEASVDSLCVYAFQVIDLGDGVEYQQAKSAQFAWLLAHGFTTPGHWMVPAAVASQEGDGDSGSDKVSGGNGTDAIGSVKRHHARLVAGGREALDYPIDGLVVEVDAPLPTALLAGSATLSPWGAVAYKFPSETGVAQLVGITWTPGTRRKMTPVATFSPVTLGGASVSRASIGSANALAALWSSCRGALPAVGDTICVARRGDVIPHVEHVIIGSGGVQMPLPTICPCGAGPVELRGKHLFCVAAPCRATREGDVLRYLRQLGLKGWGPRLVEELCTRGLVLRLGDLYRLDLGTLAGVTLQGGVLGETRATRLLAGLAAVREADLAVFLRAVGLEGTGPARVDAIVAAGFRSLQQWRGASADELMAVPGMGMVLAQTCCAALARLDADLDDLLQFVHVRDVAETAMTGTVVTGEAEGRWEAGLGAAECDAAMEDVLVGKWVIFTGFRDPQLE